MPMSDTFMYVKKTFENKWANVLSCWSKRTPLLSPFSLHGGGSRPGGKRSLPPGPSLDPPLLHVRLWVCYPSCFIEGVCTEYLLIKSDMQRGDRSRLWTSARRIPVQDFQWMTFAFMQWPAGWSLDRFHMTSRRPLLVTMKWRPCVCS